MNNRVLLGMPGNNPAGLHPPQAIDRKQFRGGTFLRPSFCIPTLTHIEITYACNESCIMCYNPTRTKVNARDRSLVFQIVQKVAQQRIPHAYLIGGDPTYGYTKDELVGLVDILADNGTSTTIVTNGQILLKEFTPRLACFGVSIHGADAETHDAVTGRKNSFAKAIRAIKTYVEDGHDVRIITCIMGRNYRQLFRIAQMVHELGAESIYFDIYEPGGIGESNSRITDFSMQPTLQQVREAITQVIQTRESIPFPGGVSFGTAVPYCLDQRLLSSGLTMACGAGTWFSAITSSGDFRLCNQSRMNFGNVLKRDIVDIWCDPVVDLCFRSLSWVTEPCASCALLERCGAGCKVDEGCADGEFCIDRIVRSNPELKHIDCQIPSTVAPSSPPQLRNFFVSPWLDYTERYRDRGDIFFKTRYETRRIGENELQILKSIRNGRSYFAEADLINAYRDQIEPQSMRNFLSWLEEAKAIASVKW